MENGESSTQSQSSASGGLPKGVLLLIILILLIGAGIGGYIVFGKNLIKQQLPTSNEKTAVAAPSPTPGSLVTSIKEALSGSQSLQCDFTDESGKKIMSYIKAGSVRTDITATDPKQSGSMIFKDKKMYFWNGKTGTVITFDIQEVENITPPVTTPSVKQAENPQDIVASLEKYKESCKQASVADELFTPPTDVKFTDLSSFTKGMPIIPSGISVSKTEEKVVETQAPTQ